MHGALFLNPVIYMSLVLRNLISTDGTNKARMNNKTKDSLLAINANKRVNGKVSRTKKQFLNLQK